MFCRSQLLASAAILLGACGSLNQVVDEDAASAGVGNAIVIGDESFEPSRGSAISIIQNHVRSMSVARKDACPRIIVRPGRSQASEALVYVDGQRMNDTCVLEALSVESISRVEVYPSGVTQRPCYRSNSGGLILVFMKNGLR